MKYLCICARGNSRSVALGWILKDLLKHEAIAIGMEASSDETKEMLYAWADYIVIVDQKYWEQVPESYKPKALLWHVGGDRFFRAFSPELLNMYAGYLYESKLAPLLGFNEPKPFYITIHAKQPV